MASGSRTVIIAALLGNFAIAVTKFTAALLTNSSAMLSEGIHSLVDTGNQILLLYGIRRARRPASAEFPFGHGKEIYFWSFIVAILIFSMGAGFSIYGGIKHILHPEMIADPQVNYIVLGLAMLFEGAAWFLAWRAFSKVKGRRGLISAVKAGKDPTMFVVLFEDSAAMLGLLIAFAGVFATQLTGDPLYDGIASILIGLVLAATAVWMATETKGLLIGEAADEEVVAGIRRILEASPDVEHVNEILTLHFGPEYILVNISLDFRDDIDAGSMELGIRGLDRKIKSVYPLVKRVFVEAESRRAHQEEQHGHRDVTA